MFGVRDSVKGLRAPQSLRSVLELIYCMENEIPRRPEFSGLHRNDKELGGWGVKKGAEAELQHLFLPLTSILIVIPNSDKIEDFRQ